MILRHTKTVRIVHWSIALSIFSLFFSGFGQMPLYKRYMLTDIAPWTGDYWLTLHLHYWGAIVLMTAVGWHIVFHSIRKERGLLPRSGDIHESYLIIKAMMTGGKEPASDKYLAEQRLAYAYIAFMVGLLIVTGVIKVIKNLGINLNDSLLFWSTQLHNLGSVLLLIGVIAHLAAFIPSANRKLLPSIFHGKVDEEYVKHRHSIWYKRLKKGN
ncbi:MAG: prokaryotic cytochrome b561 family protein [Firmicutes bacterium]|nr:prokaryotic cytochrome b561 family protein [Bacillota bacterium]